MNSDAMFDVTDAEPTPGTPLSAAPDVVEVRRNGGLAALIGVAASAVAIGYLGRAAGSGAALDWVLFAVLGVVGAVHLHQLVDARTPLLVADSQGVRIRLGRAWRGLPWGGLAAVELTPRRGLVRDGRLVLVPHNTGRVLAELDASGRRQAKLGELLYGAPFALPLGLSTRVAGGADIATALRDLAGSSARVVELVPGTAAPAETVEVVETTPAGGMRTPALIPAIAKAVSGVGSALAARSEARAVRAAERAQVAEAERVAREEAAVEAAAAAEAARIKPSPTPSALREARRGVRTEFAASAPSVDEDAVEGRSLRRQGSVDLVEEKQTWGERVRPLAQIKSSVEPLVIDDFAAQPAPDPVIGPDLRAARTRIGLTVDQLADRTRIRPHVIEAMEVDDFVPCGGDFYARGHLRTLARVLGLDAAPLLTTYDERYADAPINPRRVFEAELASGATGGIRSMRGGPNWSVLVAAVMTVVLAWSIARLMMDDPADVQTQAPLFQTGADGSGVPNYIGDQPLKLRLTGSGTGSRVVVKDDEGTVVFKGHIADGQTESVRAMPPVLVHAVDGGAVTVSVNGTSKGTLGNPGKVVDRTFHQQD